MIKTVAALALAAAATPALAQQPATAVPERLPVPAVPEGGRIFGTALNVVDLDAAVKFYTHGLGMHVATTLDFGTRTETILTFGNDPGQPSILLMHEKDPAARRPVVQGTALSRLVLGFPDIDAVAARLSRLGYSFPPVRGGGRGARVIVMSDPSGVALELVEPPSN